MPAQARPSKHSANDARRPPGKPDRGAQPILPPFDEAVEQYQLDVWRFAVSQVGHDRADDLFQETMLAALAAYPKLRDPSVTRSWLFRIAARKAVDVFRAGARDAVPVGDPDAGSAPEQPFPDEELWGQVRTLPPKQRHAVTLRYVVDLEYTEIAAAMRTSPEAARRNVHEALKSLRKHLAPNRQALDATAPEIASSPQTATSANGP